MTEHSKNTLTTILHDALVALQNHQAQLTKAKLLEAVGYIESRPTVLDDIPVREGV